jgi:hypothetical protein
MSDEISIERLERALAGCTRILVLDGPKVAPIFERLERELAAMRRNKDAMARAKALLANLEKSDLSVQDTPALTSLRKAGRET